MFKIGIGPSSSHTMGPMKAAKAFLHSLPDITTLAKIHVELYGSLALTGIGHGTDKALKLGFEGHDPETINPDDIDGILERIKQQQTLRLLGGAREIPFTSKNISLLRKKTLPRHSNGMCFYAFNAQNSLLAKARYYSFGGGFIAREDEEQAQGSSLSSSYEFHSGAELLDLCAKYHMTIPQLMMAHEETWLSQSDIESRLDHLWTAMDQCIERGIRTDGILPGRLKIKRRAPGLYRELCAQREESLRDPLNVLDWVNLYAIAVNEENAGGSKIVTAPTNGAAGIIPAVIRYYLRFCGGNQEGVRRFLLAAGAIGILYKKNGSISGAEVGCQGEVGVACSMAAGGLVAALEHPSRKVEQSAEIGMEHNLGLTCDPIGGLVQIPCIERNAMGAVKAINAARIAIRGDGTHFVSLDSVIKTMMATGADMKTQYKETSRGGLAVNVPEC